MMISNERGLLELKGNVLISPPALISPGKRTGQYRTGTDQLLADEEGESGISVEDYAVAFVDEI